MQKININYAFNGFLYAPIFLADALGFFPKNIQLVYRNGDVEAVEALCSPTPENGDRNWFAICDPFSVDISAKIPEQRDDQLCVVGSLIDKLPVWVYNPHNETQQVAEENDLSRYEQQIKKIISYPQGTTGHLIATRVQKLLRLRSDYIETKEFGTEFDAGISEDTAVISSDVLKLVHSGLNGKKIIFNYPIRSPEELRPFLFTAILTLKKEVIDDNLWCVLPILAGIKRAIYLLKQENITNETVNTLKDHFDKHLAKLAIPNDEEKQKLIKKTATYISHYMEIYSEDLRPQENAWNNAKQQWETLLARNLPCVEGRNEPIPTLLIMKNWRCNSELSNLITEKGHRTGNLLSDNYLTWYQKITLPLAGSFQLLSLFLWLKVFLRSIDNNLIKENFPQLSIAALSIAISITITGFLFKGIIKRKVERYSELCLAASGFLALGGTILWVAK